MKRLREIWEKKDVECALFFLFLVGMAFYYGWRLFALTPWYDELYTYYYFISRGPVYAAIHWPLPNNHVGFSVLSAVLAIFGSPAIGLRGVSWLCSLISLGLLFAIGKKCLPKGLALAPVFLTASMGLVNTLAVQGRGYALASCLFLTALYETIEIIGFEKRQKKHYIILACALIWSLYTLPSSVYFVLPLCVIGGVWLFVKKRRKEFFAFFITSLISALCTVGLYAIIWLAIGSNLLSKTPGSDVYGQGHVSIILHNPLLAVKTGVNYMLDTPYIQSVGREGYLSRFFLWIRSLMGSYYEGCSIVLLLCIGICLAALIYKVFQGRDSQDKEQGFFEWYLLLAFLLTPLMLIIQAALPYYRVFSFFGSLVALLLVWFLGQLTGLFRGKAAAYIVTAFCGVLCIVLLMLPARNAQYSERESAIEDAFSHMELAHGERVCVTDCDQEYLMKFLYDREDVRGPMEEADYLLLDRELFLSEEERQTRDAAGADSWKFYLSGADIPWDYLEKEMDITYENDRFILYKRK
ncbi:MAG: glycosyltransferase family 39 protein [Blautia sp.]|nr:glycosyltransferase family 39 protein [Lachnoclostridium sp.]MCM1210582.1 glycosyltransferase family 39 protein [Blautia sp.]